MMQTHPVEAHLTETAGWLRLLPRWSLFLALASLTLPIVFIGGLSQEPADPALGADFLELIQAARSPTMFRLVWTIDAAIWLMLGGSLFVFGGLLRRHAPIRASFIAICAVAQLFGALASFLRLDGISDIASYYVVADPVLQEFLKTEYLSLMRIINSANQIGVLLQGIGYILTTWAVFSLREFPRWLAIWLALPGLLAILQFGLFVTGQQYLFMLNMIGLLMGNIALNLAIAVALWQPPSALVFAVAGEHTAN